jgi:hypothetical protein
LYKILRKKTIFSNLPFPLFKKEGFFFSEWYSNVYPPFLKGDKGGLLKLVILILRKEAL